jgi:hypothetical protein
MGFIKTLQRWYFHYYAFDARDKGVFASQFASMLEAGKSLPESLETFAKYGFTSVVKKLGREALQTIQTTQNKVPIAHDWYEKGYFSLSDATLLCEAQKMFKEKGLENSFSLIAESKADSISFMGNVIFPNLIFIIMGVVGIGGFVAYGLYADELLSTFFKGPKPTIGRIADYILTNAFLITLFVSIVLGVYFYFRLKLVGRAERYRLNAAGIYLIHDFTFQFDVCAIMASFFSMKVNALRAVEVLCLIFPYGYKQTRLLAAKQSIRSGVPVNEAMGQYVFDERMFGYISGFAKDDSPKTLALAYSRSNKLAVAELQRLLGFCSGYVKLFGLIFFLIFLVSYFQLLPEFREATTNNF